jgi:hypothetical protein
MAQGYAGYALPEMGRAVSASAKQGYAANAYGEKDMDRKANATYGRITYGLRT